MANWMMKFINTGCPNDLKEKRKERRKKKEGKREKIENEGVNETERKEEEERNRVTYDKLYFVNNDNGRSNAYKQQRRAAYGLTVNALPGINGMREWESRCNPFVQKSPVNTRAIISRRDS